MFGPHQVERDFQAITLNHQERLKQVERYRQHAQAMAGEQRAARPRHNRIGDLLGRLSFRHRMAPAESAG